MMGKKARGEKASVWLRYFRVASSGVGRGARKGVSGAAMAARVLLPRPGDAGERREGGREGMRDEMDEMDEVGAFLLASFSPRSFPPSLPPSLHCFETRRSCRWD